MLVNNRGYENDMGGTQGQKMPHSLFSKSDRRIPVENSQPQTQTSNSKKKLNKWNAGAHTNHAFSSVATRRILGCSGLFIGKFRNSVTTGTIEENERRQFYLGL